MLKESQKREIAPADLMRSLWGMRRAAVAIVALCCGAAVVWSLSVTPIYRAEVLLMPTLHKTASAASAGAPGYSDLLAAAGVGARDGEREESVALLKSRAFTMEFIESGNLLPFLFSDRWDQAKREWKGRLGVGPPSLFDGYTLFNSRVRKVVEQERSQLITLVIDWPDPERAADWANALVRDVNRHAQLRAIEEGERSIRFLTDQVEQTAVDEVRDAAYRLMELQMEQVMMANVTDEYAFRVIDPAVPPEVPIRPNRRLMILAAFMLGIAVAIALAYRKAVRDRERLGTKTA
jgi:uncharacterized protein involved in exopolysaccharide biosynthesis